MLEKDLILPDRIPRIKSSTDWCMCLFRLVVKSENIKTVYQRRCPACFSNESPGRAGYGYKKAVEKWGFYEVEYALRHEDFPEKRFERIGLAKRILWRIAYQNYLNSEAWLGKRKEILNRSHGRCEVCGDAADHVHHKTYERLGDEDLEDLLAVCVKCHSDIHGRDLSSELVSAIRLRGQ